MKLNKLEKKIVRMYQRGFTTGRIQKHLGINIAQRVINEFKNEVKRVLYEAEKWAMQPPSRNQKYKHSDVADAIRLFLRGYNMGDASRICKISIGALDYRLTVFGAPLMGNNDRHVLRKKDISDMILDTMSGISVAEIAKGKGISVQTIYKILKLHAVPPPGWTDASYDSILTNTRLAVQCWFGGATAEEAAERCGVSVSAMYKANEKRPMLTRKDPAIFCAHRIGRRDTLQTACVMYLFGADRGDILQATGFKGSSGFIAAIKRRIGNDFKRIGAPLTEGSANMLISEMRGMFCPTWAICIVMDSWPAFTEMEKNVMIMASWTKERLNPFDEDNDELDRILDY